MHCFSKKSTAAKEGPNGHGAANGGKSGAIKTAGGYIEAIGKRRTIYHLGGKLPMGHKEVANTIMETVRQCPSSFNVQSARIIILFGEEHKKVWDITKAALKKKITSEEQFAQSEAKVNSCFAAGAGTILFYEDKASIKGQQEAFPSYAANFPTWSQHSSAIAQFAVWSALAQDGIGASLQHYNELIEADLREAFQISEDWQLIAQMPFGSIEQPADEKTHIPDETRFMIHDE